ncbi:MAG: DUF3006 domain-containing protein [Clostridiales bacterium]|jgi:hypothetical protein|nr:DUF3006 domain-containing protein [Clostridiales bacterium]
MNLENQTTRKILIVDRITEEYLICQELDTEINFEFEFNENYDDFHEGDVLAYDGEKLIFDQNLTDSRRRKIFNLFNSLFSND